MAAEEVSVQELVPLPLPRLAQLRQQLEEAGYCVLPCFVRSAALEALRHESDTVVATARDELGWSGRDWAVEQKGCVFESLRSGGEEGQAAGITERDAWRDLRLQAGLGEEVPKIMFSSVLRALVEALLPPAGGGASSCCLFNDQYVAKPPFSPSSSFPWHRDSDWCSGEEYEYHEYISIWVALDEMREDNGTLFIRPESGGDQVMVTLQAGGAVVLTDRVRHMSTPNMTSEWRRAWLPQFSAGPILRKDTGLPVSLAVGLNSP